MLQRSLERMARSAWEVDEVRRRLRAEMGEMAYYVWNAAFSFRVIAMFGSWFAALVAKVTVIDWLQFHPSVADPRLANAVGDTALLVLVAVSLVWMGLASWIGVGRSYRRIRKAVRAEPHSW